MSAGRLLFYNAISMMFVRNMLEMPRRAMLTLKLTILW